MPHEMSLPICVLRAHGMCTRSSCFRYECKGERGGGRGGSEEGEEENRGGRGGWMRCGRGVSV